MVAEHQNSPESRQAPRGRVWRRIRWVSAAVAVLALAALDQAARPVAGRRSAPSGEAAWIWSADPPLEVAPRAFYLVQDFEVEEPPAAARLLALGDEEYVLYLNGLRVGSNRYTSGAALDRYDVGSLLVPGANRLVAEVRSGRGTGGFLLRLEGGAGAPALAATDGTWRVFRRFDPGLAGGWLPLDSGEPPRVWGRAPTGRWGRPAAGPSRPLFPALEPPLATEAGQGGEGPPAPPLEGTGSPAEPGGHGAGAFPATLLFDFGRVVVGYLGLRFGPGDGPPALFCVGLEPPAFCEGDAAAFVLAPPGAPDWEDSLVRRLRYVAVAGLGEGTVARLLPVSEELAGGLPGAAAPERGILGLVPPPRLAPLEREVAQRLQWEAAGRE